MHHIESEIAKLNDEDFKRYIVKKMDAISSSLISLDKRMQEFRGVTVEALKIEILDRVRDNENHLKEKIEKLELDYRIFKAKVAGGVLAIVGILEAAKQIL